MHNFFANLKFGLNILFLRRLALGIEYRLGPGVGLSFGGVFVFACAGFQGFFFFFFPFCIFWQTTVETLFRSISLRMSRFGLCFLLLLASCACAAELAALEAAIVGNGFHLGLRLNGAATGGEILHIRCPFPKEVYVDRYELAELQRFDGFPPFHLSDLAIDLEKPADSPVARNFFLDLTIDLREQQPTPFELRIPFHLRYQLPSPAEESKPHRMTQLEPPIAELHTADHLLLHSATFSTGHHPLTISTPVGQECHRPWVTTITLLVTIAGAAALIFAVLKNPLSETQTRERP